MRIHAWLTRSFFAAALMIGSPALLADDKPEQAPPFIGLWQSEERAYLELLAGGDIHIVPANSMPLVGTWKQEGEGGKIKAQLRVEGHKMDMEMEIKVEGEDKASVILGGETEPFTRVKDKLDEQKLLGTWKSTDLSDEDAPSHYVVIRQQGGKGTLKSMEVMHSKKIYCTDIEEFEWRVVGERVLEIYSKGTDEEFASLFGNFVFAEDKINFEDLADDNYKMQDLRIEKPDLPEPPEGYKKVTVDQYWEAYEPEEEGEAIEVE